ncbi:gliding motility-associated C-terminal domain-containing protein, partial [Bacteroidota bacterium]
GLLLTSQALSTDLVCGNVTDGTTTAIPEGGTPPYTYQWDDPDNQTDSIAVNLDRATYTVTVTDAMGCTSVSSVEVDGPSPILSTETVVNASCTNTADGSIYLEVTGGVEPYEYNWVPGNSTEQDLVDALPQIYALTITDSTGCEEVKTYALGATVEVEASAGLGDTICSETPIELNGESNGTYSWSPSATLSDSSVANPIATPTDTTTYYLTVTVGTCTAVDSVTIYVNPKPSINAGKDLSIPKDVSIGLTVNNADENWEYAWEPEAYLDNPSVINPIASPVQSTLFYVNVIDGNGCASSDSVLVNVATELIIPDAITPNADGKNDVWIIDNIEAFEDVVVEIFNRWGQPLWQSQPGYPIPWDGTYQDKKLPVGTYYYVIHSTHIEEAYTGPITIVR